MSLFEDVQKELYTFIGAKHPEKPKSPQNFEELGLEGLGLSYLIERRPRKKIISFRVMHSGVLKINANQSISEQEILEILVPHLDWIKSQSHKRKRVKESFPQKIWQNGETFPYNGKTMTLVLTPSETKRAFIRFMSKNFEYFFPIHWLKEEKKIIEEKLHKGLLKFFKQKASLDLNEKVNHWAKIMELHPRSISFRNQKTHWGSCSNKGRINLNWKLACFDDQIQDYVIIHELTHLKHQNHSKNFWESVQVYMPDYKRHSNRLEQRSFEVDCFLPKSELYQTNPSWV